MKFSKKPALIGKRIILLIIPIFLLLIIFPPKISTNQLFPIMRFTMDVLNASSISAIYVSIALLYFCSIAYIVLYIKFKLDRLFVLSISFLLVPIIYFLLVIAFEPDLIFLAMNIFGTHVIFSIVIAIIAKARQGKNED